MADVHDSPSISITDLRKPLSRFKWDQSSETNDPIAADILYNILPYLTALSSSTSATAWEAGSLWRSFLVLSYALNSEHSSDTARIQLTGICSHEARSASPLNHFSRREGGSGFTRSFERRRSSMFGASLPKQLITVWHIGFTLFLSSFGTDFNDTLPSLQREAIMIEHSDIVSEWFGPDQSVLKQVDE